MKKKLRLRWISAFVLLFANVGWAAAPEPEIAPVDNWSFTVSLGVTDWADLSELQPAAGGRFESSGFLLEGSLQEFWQRTRYGDVYLGGDIGVFTTDSDVPGILGDFSLRGVYIGPSVRLRFDTGTQSYLELLAGAAYYEIDFAELQCETQCILIQEADEARAFGGFVGLGTGIGKSFVAELKAHFADYGSIDGLGENAGSLGGPMFTFAIGWRFYM